jgi:hypothetical protein
VSRGVADSPYRQVGESLLIYNKLKNFISQKLKKLFEPNFQRVFLYTCTASAKNTVRTCMYQLQNFISQKLKKLFEGEFQRVFLYTYTASSANFSSLALS